MATTITDYAGLVAIGSDLAGDYILGNDIDASGENFTPLGTFTGTLDGKGYAITDFTITINAAGSQKGALFTRNDGTIRDLGFEDCAISVTSTNNSARACAVATDNRGTITECWSTGTITASSGDTWTWASAAGIANTNNTLGSGTITKSYSTATCTATSPGYASAAGLVGTNYGDISESYASGNVSAAGGATRPVYAGGLVGINGYDFADYEGIITDSYARGDATATGGATNYAGGLVAEQDMASSSITDSYSTGIPTGADAAGGLLGLNTAGTITTSFWDEDTSGTAVSDGGTGKSTSEMKTKTTFTYAGWDFIVIWFINGVTNDGYAFHWTAPPEPIESPRETVDIEDKITLECVRNVEMAAGGRSYVDKEGNFCYRSRYARNA